MLPDALSRLYNCVQIDFRSTEVDPNHMPLLMSIDLLQVDEGGDDEIAKRRKEFMDNVIKKVAPSLEERSKLLEEKHSELHCGADQMFHALFRDGVYWDSMYTDCRKTCGSCKECLKYNVGKVGFHPLSPLKASLPMDHIVIDFIGPFPTSQKGYNFILILVDVLTRMVLLRPVKQKSAEEIAWLLLNVFADFGNPKILQSDMDTAFINETIKAMHECAGFEMRGIMKYFLKTNGLVERNVHETKQLILKFIRSDFSFWELYLPATQIALNDRIISAHHSRPFSLMFARKINGFKDFTATEEEDPDLYSLEERNLKMIELIFPWTSAEIESKGRERASRVNKESRIGKRTKPFKVGDKVMKKVDVRDSKLQQRWEGPFEISNFDEVKKGFQLQDTRGKQVRGWIPAEHLKMMYHWDDREEGEFFEVKEVLNHRGPSGNREYLVSWNQKGDNEWVHELDFDAYDCVRKYWTRLSKSNKVTQTEERPSTPPLNIDGL